MRALAIAVPVSFVLPGLWLLVGSALPLYVMPVLFVMLCLISLLSLLTGYGAWRGGLHKESALFVMIGAVMLMVTFSSF